MSKKYVFGVDIGGTTIKIGLFGFDGTIVDKFEIKTRKEENGTQILPDIADAVRNECEDRKISFADVKGIGVGVPGPVLEHGIVNHCVNLGWGRVPIEEELSGRLDGVHVKAGNDANVAALGELCRGGAKGYKNAVMVTLGTGVGGGVVIDRRIVAGSFGAGGEIGHIRMSDTETETCGCGKRGCLEQYASASGVSRAAKTMMGRDLSAKEVFDLAKKGDEKAEKVVDFMACRLGTALSYISCVVDPEIYVIGGGVSGAGLYLLDKIQYYYRQSAFHASAETKFALARLGNDAGIYGAADLVLEG